jgi:hypothetical protein
MGNRRALLTSELPQSTKSTEPIAFVPDLRPFCIKDETTDSKYCVQNLLSSLLFCSSSDCTSSSATPANKLYVNENFWLVHALTDTHFAGVTLDPGKVVFSASGSD